jgi:sec-independent protein translocase protein TatA
MHPITDKRTEEAEWMRIGMPELVIVLVIALLIFGPKKLPELGSAIGKAIRGFKKSTEENADSAALRTCPRCHGPVLPSAGYCSSCGAEAGRPS